jgi:hypothetical protein
MPALLIACADAPASLDTAAIWSLPPAPGISIGVADGDERYMFTTIIGARLLRNGGVVVADRLPALTIYDSTGAFVHRFGRSGSGPGEFQFLFNPPFVYRGDSIAVWDLGQRRVSVFDAAGTFVRAVPIHVPRQFWPPGTIPDQSCCSVRHALADGSFILEYPGLIPTEPGPDRYSTVTLARVRPDGSTADTIGAFTSRLYHSDPTAPRGTRGFRVTPRFAHDVGGDTVFAGNGAGAWVLRIVPGSAPDTITLEQREPVPLTEATRDAYAAAYRAEYARRPEIFEGPIDEFIEGKYPPHLPAYTGILYDGAGGLWLRQWQLPFVDDSVRFDVYSTRGRAVARFALPVASRIADVRGNRIALVETDSLGVEHVRVYDLVKAR